MAGLLGASKAGGLFLHGGHATRKVVFICLESVGGQAG